MNTVLLYLDLPKVTQLLSGQDSNLLMSDFKVHAFHHIRHTGQGSGRKTQSVEMG